MTSAVANESKSAENIHAATAMRDLVQLAQSGSHSAFETLQRTYSRRLFKQIIAITKHYEDAEDALQDALCRAYLALPSFEQRCHIYTWLSRIAINCALMKVRKRQNLRESSFEGQDAGDDQEPFPEIPDPGWSPENLYEAKEKLGLIADVVQSLDPVSRHVIHLRVNDECSMQEIAGSMSLSVSAVKARLYRARHALRVFLPDPIYREAASWRL